MIISNGNIILIYIFMLLSDEGKKDLVNNNPFPYDECIKRERIHSSSMLLEYS